MDYYKLVGTCKTIGLPVRMRGIGDEPLPPGVKVVSHKTNSKLPKGCKVDQHSSIVKHLPIMFSSRDEHSKD